MNNAPKKPAIMTSVHSVRVQKFAFFFSYSAFFSAAVEGFCLPSVSSTQSFLGDARGRAKQNKENSNSYRVRELTSSTTASLAWFCALVLVGDPSSLLSLKLDRRPSEPLNWPLAFFMGDFPPLFDLAMASYGSLRCAGAGQAVAIWRRQDMLSGLLGARLSTEELLRTAMRSCS